MNKSFSVKETIAFGVRTILDQPRYFMKLFIYWFFFSLVGMLPLFGLISVMANFGALATASLGIVLFVILGMVILLAYFLVLAYIWWTPIKLLLHWYDTKSEALFFNDFFRLFSITQLFRLICIFSLYGIIVALGLFPAFILWLSCSLLFTM